MQPMEKNHHKTNSFECIINKSIAIINVRTFTSRFRDRKVETLDNTFAKKRPSFRRPVAKLQASVNIIKVHKMTFAKKCLNSLGCYFSQGWRSCKKCRYQKCTENGMDPDLVSAQPGRQRKFSALCQTLQNVDQIEKCVK